MKRTKVLYTFACLFVITWVYLDLIIELQSVYWLIAKYVWVALIIGGRKYLDCMSGIKANIINTIASLLTLLLVFGFNCYQDIKRYKLRTCQDKFGKEFNERRQRIGIPKIPADWHIESRSFSVEWKGKDHVIGHALKVIGIDSICAAASERDEYNIKPLINKARKISILFRYARGNDKDSISFDYTLGDSTYKISRQQADSIFSAEKINKDY